MHLNLRAGDHDRYAGEPGAGAIVQQISDVEGKMLSGKRALDKMAADDLFGFSDGGQVQPLVPTQQ